MLTSVRHARAGFTARLAQVGPQSLQKLARQDTIVHPEREPLISFRALQAHSQQVLALPQTPSVQFVLLGRSVQGKAKLHLPERVASDTTVPQVLKRLVSCLVQKARIQDCAT